MKLRKIENLEVQTQCDTGTRVSSFRGHMWHHSQQYYHYNHGYIGRYQIVTNSGVLTTVGPANNYSEKSKFASAFSEMFES